VATRGDRATGIEAVRAREIGRVLQDRFGYRLPDNDAGRHSLRVMLCQLARLRDHQKRMVNFIELQAPWLSGDDWFSFIDEAIRSPAHMTADEIAAELQVDYAARQRLRLTTIGAIDVDKTERKRLRKVRRAARERERRARKRLSTLTQAVTRQETLARSAALCRALASMSGWTSSADLVRAVAGWASFRGVSARSLPRIISRGLDELLVAGAIEQKMINGKTGLRKRLVRLR
jgi:hypothetical protein